MSITFMKVNSGPYWLYRYLPELFWCTKASAGFCALRPAADRVACPERPF